jgi:1-acyl-sn-glycerol-3-phosphate acyltransferase
MSTPPSPPGCSARLRQAGKILVSGLLFTLLAVGGLALTVLALPVLRCLPGGREGRARRARRLVRACFRLFVVAFEGSGILRLQVSGLPAPERLAGTVVVSNHPSWLDAVLIIASLPPVVCVVKPAIYDNLAFGGVVRAAGYLTGRDPAALLSAGAAALRRGETLLVFPEGTRTVPGRPFRFQRGAAHLACLAGAPVLPLVVACTPPLLAKGNRWYDVPIETCQFSIRAGDVWSGPGPEGEGAPRAAARRLGAELERFYDKELRGHDQG